MNAILANGQSQPIELLGGLVRFLHKPGGDPLEPSSYCPKCLFNTTYKVLSRAAIVNDRLYCLCKRDGFLNSSQEGFQSLRCTRRQVQSLH